MPQPTPSDVHVDAALTNISVAYVQNENNFVAHNVFPVVPVNHQTDKYHIFVKNDWFRDDVVTKRAPETESSGSGFTMSTDSYTAEVWATHIDIDDQTRANADPGVDIETSSTRLVTQRMLIRRERIWTTEHFTTGAWGTDVVGGTNFTRWDDFGSSDPADDVDLGRETILQNTGFEPNTMVMDFKTFNKLKKHPLILERYKMTSAESVTVELLARYFEVDRILVMKSVYATNAEGGTAAYSFIAGKNCLLCYVNPTPQLMMPSAGYTMAWNGLSQVSGLQESGAGIAISNIDLRGSGKKVDRVEGEFAFDMKLVASDLGYFFSGTIA